MAPRLPRLARTLRHLRPSQLAHQVLHRARGPARRPRAALAPGLTGLAEHVAGWPYTCPDGHLDEKGGVVALLDQPPHDPRAGGWDVPDRDPLWRYTLHYHGWLAGVGDADDERGTLARSLVYDWIDRHRQGTGWEPYPTSMRALQWIRWLADTRVDTRPERGLLDSLAAQLEHLARHVERHLGGNHLWTNLAALSAAGLALEGPLADALRQRWLPELASVVADQLAADGVHRERTPTYHCLLAAQLGGVVWLLERSPRTHDVLGPLKRAHDAMLAALPAFTHPDGDVALWGDSQLGAPVPPAALGPPPGPGNSNADAPASRLFRRAWGPWTVLWNAGSVGMAHQVGHIHADGLALELSIGRERVLVDAGVGTYARGPERDYARGTRSHNTVEILDPRGRGDQHELWASHRIGGRARCGELEHDANHLRGQIQAYGSEVWHERSLRRDGRRVICVDRVRPGPAPATARFHVPEACAITPAPGGFRIATPGGQRFEITSAPPPRLLPQPVPGWRGMNRPAPRRCLAAPVPADGLTTVFRALE